MKKETPIVQVGEPVLRHTAELVPVDKIATKEFQSLIKTMIEVMRSAPGVGLAAPQIGVPWRVFVLEDPPELMAYLTAEERDERERVAVDTRVFINPVLRVVDSEKVGFFEGCLSVDGYAGYVERYRHVEVSGLDQHGELQHWKVSGWPARIVQHEFDHLEGALYIDRMATRSFSTAESARRLYAGKSIAEVRRSLGL